MRTHITTALLLVSPLLTGCPGRACESDATPEIILGQGASSAFEPFADGQEVPLTFAPQGGMGISVRALTTGLSTEQDVELILSTEIGGEQTGLFETTGIFTCQEDGHGLLWGQVVGFDADLYPDIDDLLTLDGERVDVVITATDDRGRTAEGRATITLMVSR